MSDQFIRKIQWHPDAYNYQFDEKKITPIIETWRSFLTKYPVGSKLSFSKSRGDGCTMGCEKRIECAADFIIEFESHALLLLCLDTCTFTVYRSGCSFRLFEQVDLEAWTELYRQNHADRIERAQKHIEMKLQYLLRDDQEKIDDPQELHSIMCLGRSDNLPDQWTNAHHKAFGYTIQVDGSDAHDYERTMKSPVTELYRDLKHAYSVEQLQVDQRTKPHIAYVKIKNIEMDAPNRYYVKTECGYFAKDGSTRDVPPIELIALDKLKDGQKYFLELMKHEPTVEEASRWLIQDREKVVEDYRWYVPEANDFMCDWCKGKENKKWKSHLRIHIAVFHDYREHLCEECTNVMQDCINRHCPTTSTDQTSTIEPDETTDQTVGRKRARI